MKAKFSKIIKDKRFFLKFNLFFILIFLNIWDYIVSRELLNAMVIGIIMFGPAVFLWFVGTLRAIALIILISIFEFMIMAILVAQGFQLADWVNSSRTLFWVPSLLVSGLNGFWGLKLYSQYRERRTR